MEDILFIPELRNSIFFSLELYDLYNIRKCNRLFNNYVSDFSSEIILNIIVKIKFIINNEHYFQYSENLQFIDIYYLYYHIFILIHTSYQKKNYNEFIIFLKSTRIKKYNIPNIHNLDNLMIKFLKYPFYLNQDHQYNEPKQIWSKINNKWIITEIIQPNNILESELESLNLMKYNFNLCKLKSL